MLGKAATRILLAKWGEFLVLSRRKRDSKKCLLHVLLPAAGTRTRNGNHEGTLCSSAFCNVEWLCPWNILRKKLRYQPFQLDACTSCFPELRILSKLQQFDPSLSLLFVRAPIQRLVSTHMPLVQLTCVNLFKFSTFGEWWGSSLGPYNFIFSKPKEQVIRRWPGKVCIITERFGI